jgi:hypothetical protein
MAMQCKKTWVIIFLFKEFQSFFNKSIPSGMSLNNQHLLILDGHGNHVTLENNKISKFFWVTHDHIAIAHITCNITIRFVLFQTF